MSLAIKEMLLIEEPTIQILKDEMMTISYWFVLPSFVIALCLEYFGDLKFGDVIKKLILILAFMSVFYSLHSQGVDLSFKASEEILKKVSPRNIFLKSWTETKVRTNEDASWNFIQKFSIPNINDLLGTSLFVLSKAFIWILKLIYSTVYHLTYVFAPLTAILYFFPITRSSIAGTIQSSLWCIFMPIVLVSILAIVGNSIQSPAKEGTLAILSIDHIVWIFGVTLLMLMTPVLTIGLLRGGGVALSGSAIGAMMTNSAMKVFRAAPKVMNGLQSTTQKATKTGAKALFEPSINELMRKEREKSPERMKSELLNQKGGVRNPFKASSGLDERLSKVGMTRDEAKIISRMSSSGNGKNQSTQEQRSSLNAQSLEKQDQGKESFVFDKSFWNSITPKHEQRIRQKYGIDSEIPNPNKIYYPVKKLEVSRQRDSLLKPQAPPSLKKLEVKSIKRINPLNVNSRGQYEIRNI